MKNAALTIGLMALVFWSSCPASANDGRSTSAQEPAPQAAEALPQGDADAASRLIEEAESLRARLEAQSNEIAALEKRLPGELPAMRVVVEERLGIERAGRHILLGDLIGNLQRRREIGLDVDAETSNVGALLRAEALVTRREIERTRRASGALFEKLPSVSPEQAIRLTDLLVDGSVRTSVALEALQESCRRLTALDLDTRAEIDYLHRFLEERARTLGSFIRIVDRQIAHLQARLEDTPGEAALAGELASLRRQKTHATTTLAKTIHLMNEEQLETAEHSTVLLETSGSFGEAGINTTAGLQAGRRWLNRTGAWAKEELPAFALRLLLFVLILAISKLAARFARRLVRRAIDASDLPLSQLLRDFFINMTSKAVVLVGVLIGLSNLGIRLAPMIAGLGIAGFVVGFALQESLSNFAAGMMILVYRPYDVGDIISASGITGTVSHQSLVSTTVRTFDNQSVIIPNRKIWGDVITNVTDQPTRRVDLVFGIGYGDDMDKAERILNELVGAHELVLQTPEPTIKLQNLGDSAVDYVVRPWVKTEDYWTVLWDITREVKRRFDAEGISIPFPQRDVHVYQDQTA